jgi:iron complex outermembrane receptor protein
LDETKIDSNVEVAFRIGYHSEDQWAAGIYIENLTDEESWGGQNNNDGILPAHYFGPKRPRTIGANLSYEW